MKKHTCSGGGGSRKHQVAGNDGPRAVAFDAVAGSGVPQVALRTTPGAEAESEREV